MFHLVHLLLVFFKAIRVSQVMSIDFYQSFSLKAAGGCYEVLNSSKEELQSNFSRDSGNVLKAALSFVSI